MRAAVRVALAAAMLVSVCMVSARADDATPEATLKAYLSALKDARFDDAYERCSKAMRQGKSKDDWVKEQKQLMAFADVKIFNFTVYPAKVQGDTAQVPNILESQDKLVNTLGLTEYELYTLVREDGAWKVDSQILLEPAEQAKWFPKGAKPKESGSH